MSDLKKHSASILFVDDEEQTRKYFKMGLKSHFEILTAANLAEAKEILEEKGDEIGVVITDQRMPGGNGVELLRFLKLNHPTIIRLLATAYSDLTEAIEAVNSGEIFRYIQKPWKDFETLRMELSQAMELFEARQQRDELLREKFTIRKKMTKVERIRMLASAMTCLSVKLNAAQELLKILANEKNQDEFTFDNLDFGKQDVLEARFQINLVERIKEKMASLNGQNLDKAFVSKLLGVEVSDYDYGDIKFQISLRGNSNFLTANSDNFTSDDMLNLLALCLVCDGKNMMVNVDMVDGVLNCVVMKNSSVNVVTNDLESVILSALLA